MKYFTLLITVWMVSISCNKTSYTNPEANSIIFGEYFDSCSSNCVQVYKLEGTTLYKDINPTYPGVEPYTFSALANDKFNKAKIVRYSFPDDVYNHDDTTFGNPDSHHQGGTLLIVNKDGVRHKIRMDNDTIMLPETYHYISNYIREVIDSIQ